MSEALIAAQRRLNTAKERARRKRLGPKLALSDSALDAMTSADVMAASEDEAVNFWRSAVKGPLRDLLDATPWEGGA